MGLRLNGSTSGYVELNAPAVAGTTNLTMPLTGFGKVLQVVFSTYSTVTTIASTTYTDTGLSGTITPSSTNSKIFIMVFQSFSTYRGGNDTGHGVQLLRGSTAIFTPAASKYESGYIYAVGATTTQHIGFTPLMYLDSPNSTTSLIYKTQGAMWTTVSGANVVYQPNSSISSMALIEVGP